MLGKAQFIKNSHGMAKSKAMPPYKSLVCFNEPKESIADDETVTVEPELAQEQVRQKNEMSL